MRVLVFGAGAIGSLFAALFARAGETVEVVARPDHVRAIREHGLRVEGSVEGSWPVAAYEHLTAASNPDLVLLTVKSFHLKASARLLAEVLPRPTPILLPQNGLGIEGIVGRTMEGAGRFLETPPLVRAVTTLPATWVAPGHVRYAGSGEVRLGRPRGDTPLDRATRSFFALFERARIPVRYVDDLESALWTKAVVNGAINPVTAAYSVLNGALLDPPYRSLAESLAREGLEAARAAGHPLDASLVLGELWRTLEATAANRSSMLQDVDRGRPTEIDVISGALLAAGRAGGVRMPETEAILARLRSRLTPAEQRS